ncbi:MAG: SDR family oxidoreductase [Clostridiales bacterium]|nr:SDR family oxidoreductase [Clostridiales bacterium]
MNLLITGSEGFMGKNLCAALSQREDTLYRIDVDATDAQLLYAATNADFVFHLAGVNRPKDDSEFQAGNADFTNMLLGLLEAGKAPPVLLSGSTQAALDNPYGQSKRQAEEAVLAYHRRTGAAVYRYRLTNAFGKWSRPNYNSAVATFCHNIARGLPVTVNDPARVVRLVYIDDIVAEFLRALDGHATQGEEGFCAALPEHEIELGRLVGLLESFRDSRAGQYLPDQTDPLVRKLYATYQSFLPPDELAAFPAVHADSRGSFTELLHMGNYGQVSVNVSRPGILKGEHWHHSKHEKFVVVAGRGIIRLRDARGGAVYAYPVEGARPAVVDIPPGYTHNIENLGETDMVTLMWASEAFDPNRPDTYRLPVTPETGE